MFGKKNTPVSKERLQAALRGSVPEGAKPPQMQTHRRRPRADRQSTWATCVLVWEPKGREEGICIDISETGAKIRFSHKVFVPQRFFFVSSKLAINAAAEFVRQDGHDLAIRFVV